MSEKTWKAPALMMMIVGLPGSGKTHESIQFKNSLFINLDKDRFAESKFDGKSISPPSTVGALNMLCYLAGPLKDIDGMFSESHYHSLTKKGQASPEKILSKCDVIIIDSLTALSKICFDYAKEINTKDSVTDSRGTYFSYSDIFGRVMKAIKNLSKTHLVICTAQLLEQPDEMTGKVSYKAHMEGSKTSLDVVGAMDVVLTLTTTRVSGNGLERCLVSDFINDRGLPAKDRTGKFIYEIKKPLREYMEEIF